MTGHRRSAFVAVLAAGVAAVRLVQAASPAPAPIGDDDSVAPAARSWPSAPADQPGGGRTLPMPKVRDVRAEVPIVSYTYGAAGAEAKTLGAQGYGLGLAAAGQSAVLGGGVTAWGAPIDRLTLVVDAQRNAWGNFAPSAAAMWRLLGRRDSGFILSGLGKFKIDGFAAGPSKNEVESEVELGVLLGLAGAGWHFDTNAIAGRGTGDEGETDAEARLRLGRDLGRYVRLGLDGQGRLRLAGPRHLPNGRTWDFAAGSQVFVGSRSFFGSFTAGPATMGLTSHSLGALAMLSFGGTT